MEPKPTNKPMLPDEALHALLATVHHGRLLRLLKSDEDLCQQVFQGFKVQPDSLRMTPVQRRLRERLNADEELLVMTLALWLEERREAVKAVRQRSVTALKTELPQLAARWGSGLLTLALITDERVTVQDLAESKRKVLDKFPAPPSKAQPSRLALDAEEADAAPHPEPLDALRAQRDKWQQRAAAQGARAAQLAKELAQRQTELRRATQQLTALQQRLAEADAQRESLEKQVDRLTRQRQKAERATAEQAAESKRLRKQVRQLTLAREELRRQQGSGGAEGQGSSKGSGLRVEGSGAVVATLNPLPPASPASPTPAPAVARKTSTPAGGDGVLRWQVSGQPHTVPLKRLVAAVDRGDETLVYQTANALRQLRQEDQAQFVAVVSQLRRAGLYYSCVLTQPTARVIVDGSNVAHAEKNRSGQARLQNLLKMREALRRLDFFPIVIYADASLPYQIDQREELLRLVQRGEIHLVPAGTPADDVIAREARESGGYVVTNDRRLADHLDPHWEMPAIAFRIVDGEVWLDDM